MKCSRIVRLFVVGLSCKESNGSGETWRRFLSLSPYPLWASDVQLWFGCIHRLRLDLVLVLVLVLRLDLLAQLRIDSLEHLCRWYHCFDRCSLCGRFVLRLLHCSRRRRPMPTVTQPAGFHWTTTLPLIVLSPYLSRVHCHCWSSSNVVGGEIHQ